MIIGVHSPEFSHEKDPDNVRNAIDRLDVPYPVVLDNDFRTWRATRTATGPHSTWWTNAVRYVIGT